MGWYDTQLDVECVFRAGVDGAIRCVPWLRDSQFGYQGFEIMYTDAVCMNAVVVLGEHVPVPPYSHGDPIRADACSDLRYPVYRLGGVVTRTEFVYRRNSVSGLCVNIASGMPDGAIAYALEEEIDPQELLAAQRGVPDTGERLRPIEVHGDDGSFQRVGIWDATRNEECARVAGTGRLCVPSPLASISKTSFADDACTIAVAYPSEGMAYETNCSATGLAIEEGSVDSCGSARTVRLFEVGKAIDGPAPFALADGSCVQVETSDPYQEVLSEVAEDTLDVVEAGYVGRGRLRIETLIGTQGTRLDAADGSPQLKDNSLGAACRPSTACNNALLCEPLQSAIGFADSRCKQSVMESALEDHCSSELPRYAGSFRPHGSCWDGGIVEVGDVLTSDTYFSRDDDACSGPLTVQEGRALRVCKTSSVAPLGLLDRIE
jgi:hypothetical protein